MVAVVESAVPVETGLKTARFLPAVADQAYTSPDAWRKPSPKAGPFQAKLTDGSVITYYWYRCIDQPSLQDADLSDAEKVRLQNIVEKIHAQWTPRKQYMAPPSKGALTTLDTALMVTPPRGLEVGYVPIVTKQAPR